ncbi:MAG: ClcB-like voltage-gated chloride channel protein [Steroidobacteraceae bacterium]
MANPVRDLPHLSLSLVTRLRLLLFGHEDLAGILFWAALTGFFGALATVAFRESLALLERIFTGQREAGLVDAAIELVWWHRMAIPVVGGLLAGLVLHWAGRVLTVPRAADYMEAVLVGDGRIGFRTALVNSLSSLCSIASGGSIGREGSMVQLAAMVGSKLGALARCSIPRLRLMVACGAAAGIAAAYNAPISGALFVSEIVLGNMAMESFGPLVVASVVSNVTIHRFLQYGPLFDVPHVQFHSNVELVFFSLLGVLLGHLAPLFLNLIDFAKSRFVRLHWPPYLQLALGGVIVGAISIWVPQVWGNGYSVVGDILDGRTIGVWLLIVLLAKTAATAATVGSGGVGGILTPTLFLGCAIGTLVGELMHAALPTITSAPAGYGLIGMGGFLAATTHAPLTSILMVFEMTGDYQIVLPLMLVCVTAHFTAKVYRHGESVYHASLAHTASASAPDDWRLRTVEPLVKPAASMVPRTTTVKDLLEQLPKRPLERVYIVDGDQLIAWVDPRRVLEQVQKGSIDGKVAVEHIAHPVSFALSPDMALGTALDGFLREQATVLPVTLGPWRNSLVGEVSRRDVLLAIQDRLTVPK